MFLASLVIAYLVVVENFGKKSNEFLKIYVVPKTTKN